MIEEKEIFELLRKKGKYLFHREGQCLEFKEQYNFAALADYFRDFSAFSNNRGGLLVFGVTDTPRTATGLSQKSLEAFEKIDPEKISGFLLNIFSSNISWEQAVFEFGGKHFGVFKISEADVKPVIAKSDEGKDQTIKNGEIYYRYGERTQKIQFAELESIINRRIEQNNRDWIDHVKSIGREGPSNAIVLKSEQSLKDVKNTPLVMSKELAKKIKFIKEGQFDEKVGAVTLKVVGDVVPFDTVEIEKVVKENLFKSYPLSATDLAIEVGKKIPGVKKNSIWKAITNNDIKGNADYSAYNFRNRKHEEVYEKLGRIQQGTPVIYNFSSVELLVKLLS
ncbi:MAG: hypothetical protein COA84_15880 [Robiginitomaculum sp.]|nr:MAG: hypothetical protein COA84_15880 [Robiginitomaculum sp.]